MFIPASLLGSSTLHIKSHTPSRDGGGSGTRGRFQAPPMDPNDPLANFGGGGGEGAARGRFVAAPALDPLGGYRGLGGGAAPGAQGYLSYGGAVGMRAGGSSVMQHPRPTLPIAPTSIASGFGLGIWE